MHARWSAEAVFREARQRSRWKPYGMAEALEQYAAARARLTEI